MHLCQLSLLHFSSLFLVLLFFLFLSSHLISLSSFAAFVSVVPLWIAFDFLWHMSFDWNVTISCIYVFWYSVAKTLDVLFATSPNLLWCSYIAIKYSKLTTWSTLHRRKKTKCSYFLIWENPKILEFWDGGFLFKLSVLKWIWVGTVSPLSNELKDLIKFNLTRQRNPGG